MVVGFKRTLPRHQVYKSEDIYECVVCNKLYSGLIIDLHLDVCPKLPAFIAARELEEEEDVLS